MSSNKNLRPKISAVIPHMNGVENSEAALTLCIKSLGWRVDELIIERNDGVGFATAVNAGLHKATGDYLLIVNNDTRVIKGNFSKFLKAPNLVTVPKIVPAPRDNNPRAFYCISRQTYNKMLSVYGYYLDERFEMGYFEDDDLIKRFDEQDIFIAYEPSIVVEHLHGGGLTMKQVGEQKYFDINKQKFEEKWNTHT